MSTPSKPAPEGEPGHYGAGYGERIPEDAGSTSRVADDLTAPAGLEPIDRRLDPNAPAASSAPATGRDAAAMDDGASADATDGPVVFTPADVHARPPDHPPTEAAPASEKAGLIFERS
jgi:hypothetical protein